MPTVNVDKELLYKSLGKSYSTEEFRELCFHFGIELEEDTSETVVKDGQTIEKPLLKVDISANRYDLLCQEGIARALRVFLKLGTVPVYRLVKPVGDLEKIVVHPDTAKIRPFVVGAILRNIKFNEDSYNSFIDLQDKLHNNICRKRTLASMGTHDLDTIKGPFTYEALAPKDIKFVPLNQTQQMDGNQLMEFYTADKHLGKFLHIIRDSPVYPVIYDSSKTVCSLPPIINSEHSKITLNTRNVFIEITATDEHKANTVLNTLTTMFSEYCEEPYTIEPVEIHYPDGTVKVTPDIADRRATAKVDYINSCTNLSLSPQEICDLLKQMSMLATVNPADNNEILVEVPPTRSDILHACDIMEDVAIAYGYDNLPKRVPNVNTVAAPFPINKLSDAARRELALAGFTEVAPLTLCSHDENFKFLNRVDDGTTAVKLANPKTVEYQVVRTSLLPGILKTINSNRKHPLPIKIFEVSDITLKDDSYERKSRNERRVCAAYSSKTSGFEVIHGLLDRMMKMFNIQFVGRNSNELGYWITEAENATYFPGRSADIYLTYLSPETYRRTTAKIGSLGVLHPEVLQNYELSYPTTVLEFNLEPLL
ncbi:phenylalanine--tRNA ligase subunit beta [Umbelopsis sp. WA50703]